MSWTDDQSAELDAQLDLAWQKCRFGKKHSGAFEIAERIKLFKFILSKKEKGDADPDLNSVERKMLMQTAGLLLISAMTQPKKLREVADALDAEQNEDPRQANILKAYEDCIEGRYEATIAEVGQNFVRCYVPTLAQLRAAFVKRFGEQCWSSDFSVRKTLRILGLPLTKSKSRRPIGS